MAYLAVAIAGACGLWLFIYPFAAETSMRVPNVVIPPTVAFAATCLLVLWRRPAAPRVRQPWRPDRRVRLPRGRCGGRRDGGAGQGVGDAGLTFLAQLTVGNVVFVAVLYGFARLLERQAAARAAAEVTAEFALTDVLTGLHTRLALGVRFEQALALARPSERLLAVCFIDLDGFKPVNDEHGHAAGDALLRQFARRLAASVRESDTVARLGGDEFVVLAFVDDAAQAQDVVDGLVAAGNGPFLVGDREVDLGVSVGLSLYPDDGDDAAALLASADDDMYAFKAERKRRGVTIRPVWAAPVGGAC